MNGKACSYVQIQDEKLLKMFCGPLPAGEGYAEVPDGWPYFAPGLDVKNFDANWNLRPLADRIAEGLAVVGEAEKIVGERIVAKDQYERVRDGIDKAPEGAKLAIAEDGSMSFESMTTAERVAAGEITPETGAVIRAAEVRYERNARMADCDWTQTDDQPAEVKALWKPYRQALRDIPQQAGFPWSIEWPVRPDGVVD